MKTHALTMLCIAALSSPTLAQAQNRCPAGQSGCTIENAAERIQQRVNQGAQRVINNSNPQGRVNEVRRTLQDCLNCGTDAIREGMNRVTSNSSSSSPNN